MSQRRPRGDGGDGGNGAGPVDARAVASAVVQVASALGGVHDVEQAVHATVAAVARAVGASSATLLGRERDRLHIRSIDGVSAEVATRSTSIPLDDSTPPGLAARTGRRVVVADRAQLEARFPVLAELPTATRSWLVEPLLLGTGEARALVGVLGLGFAAPGRAADGAVGAVVAGAAPLVALAARWRELAADEQTYRSLVDANLIGVSVATQERVLEANRAYLEMMGLQPSDLESGAVDWSAMTPPEYRRLDEEAIEVLRATGRSGPYEKEQVTRDGRVVPVRIGAALLEQEPLRWVAFVEDLTAERARMAELLALHERLRDEVAHQHDAIATLQAAFVPRLPPTLGSLTLSARYLPAASAAGVGGDWFDAVEDAQGRVHLVVGDVAGSGVAAAATMAELRTGLRTLLAVGEAPAVALRHASEVLRRFRPDWMATAAIATVSADASSVEYVSAGHLPLLHVRAGAVAELVPVVPAPPLGVATRADAPVARCTLAPQDLLVLYTDGLVERRGLLLDDRLAELAQTVAAAAVHEHDLPERVMAAMLRDSGRRDDACLLVVRTGGGSLGS